MPARPPAPDHDRRRDNAPTRPRRRSIRVLRAVVVSALAGATALAIGAILPSGVVAISVVAAIFVGVVTRTLSWVAGGPTDERASFVAVAAGAGAGAATLALAALCVVAGPAALVLVPLATAAGLATCWIRIS